MMARSLDFIMALAFRTETENVGVLARFWGYGRDADTG
jgi:hypothetical protein